MASTFTPLDALQERMLEIFSVEGVGGAAGLIIFLRGLPGSGKTKLARQLKEIFPDDTQIFSISQFITNWKPNTSISANSDELSLATAACKQAGK
ncbi:unnamed protein product [Hymenolepis diminuta]|uniref:ATPase n=1 Tax=Hymenolepis diminuta TaxID=6216 RepID=A0A0R3SXY6_HYMDI|nr:unnamed protein product [Hymenolepis diminuta]VUZ56878.1 unnamed protein product [Hymenolepis diminuta]